MSDLRVSSAALVNAPADDVRMGLLGWVSCVLNETILVDGITLRRSATGHLTLGFPTRRDRSGRNHPVIRPVSRESRQRLERQIFKALRIVAEEFAP